MIYTEAFRSWVYEVWGDTDYYYTSFNDLCYKKALNCYVNDGEDGVRDRMNLLFEFLKKWISSKTTNDLLNKHKHNLPVDNDFILKYINNVCQIYSNPVEREIEDESLLQLLKDCDIDDVIDKCHKLSKIVDRVAVYPFMQDDKLQFYIITPEYYRTEWENNKLVKMTYLIPFIDDAPVEISNINHIKHKVQYKQYIWTNENLEIKTKDSSKIEKNKYGFIPFVELRLTGYNTYDMHDRSGGGYSLLLDQLRLNTMELMSMENEIYGTLGFWIFKNIKNIDKDGVELGAGRYIQIDHDDKDQPEPSIEFLTAEKHFDLLSEHIKQYTESKLKLKGMPRSLINDNREMSGRAIELDRIELTELRKQDKRVLKRFDIELVNMICKIRTKDGYLTKEPKEYNIKYSDNIEIPDKKEQFEYLNNLLELGIISIIDFTKEIREIGSDVDVEDLLIKNREINERFISKSVGAGESEQASTNATNDITEIGVVGEATNGNTENITR
jgi:hypothetical protein